MRLVRHYDQNERKTDGAVHWKSMGPKLRQAFHKIGGHKFSDSDFAPAYPQSKQQKWVSNIAKIPKTSYGIFALFKDTLVGTWLPLSWCVTSLFHRNEKNSCWCHFNPQVGTDSWRKREQRGTTNHLHHTSWPVRGQSRRRRTHRRLIEAEKSTLSRQVGTLSRRRLLDQFSPSTRKGTAVLADKISRHHCSRFSAGRLPSTKRYPRKETELCIEDSPRPGQLRR